MLKTMNDFLQDLGEGLLFFVLVVKTATFKSLRWQLIYEQIWRISVQSLFTTGMAGFFVGAVMSIQFSMQVLEFGALSYLGGLATSGTIREVGPLLIAFMLSAKVGAYTSAELGTMKVTEQIDAIRCLGADPVQEIVVPRFFGIVVSSFLLLTAGLLLSVFGGLLAGVYFAGISPYEYLRHIPTIVTKISIFSGLLKSFIFALVLSTICTYKGYHAYGGAQGVGRAVIQTAVVTMLSLVLADWFTSFIMDRVLLAMGIYF